MWRPTLAVALVSVIIASQLVVSQQYQRVADEITVLTGSFEIAITPEREEGSGCELH